MVRVPDLKSGDPELKYKLIRSDHHLNFFQLGCSIFCADMLCLLEKLVEFSAYSFKYSVLNP